MMQPDVCPAASPGDGSYGPTLFPTWQVSGMNAAAWFLETNAATIIRRSMFLSVGDLNKA